MSAPPFAVYMSFMVFNITHNIIAQDCVTSLSRGVGLVALEIVQTHEAVLTGKLFTEVKLAAGLTAAGKLDELQ